MFQPFEKPMFDLLRRRCEEFAAKVQPTNIYSEDNVNAERVFNHIVKGKMGEFYMALHLDKYGECSLPDLRIYPAKDKSYDADLQLNGTDVHCKTTCRESARRFGEAWAFNHNDPLIRDPGDALVCLCTIDMNTGKAQIYGPFLAADIIPCLEPQTADQKKARKRILRKKNIPFL